MQCDAMRRGAHNAVMRVGWGSKGLLLLLLSAELLLGDADEPVDEEGGEDVEDDVDPEDAGERLV
jgi:hypothetical protein